MEVKTIRDLTKKQRTLFKYGEEAFEKKNYPYAVTMYRRVLKSVPEALEIREKLHEAQMRRVNNTPSALRGIWAGIVASVLGMYIAKLAGEGKHGEAIDLGEYVMTIEPTSPAAADLVAKAATAADMNEIGKLTLEHAYKYNPKDPGTIEHLAWVYAQLNQGTNCLRMYQILSDLQPNKEIWKDKVKEASALASMERGGWNEAEKGSADYRTIMKDQDEAAMLEQEGRTHATSAGREQLIESQLNLCGKQATVENYSRLAELYRDDKQWDNAIEWFNKSMEVAGVEDPAIQRAITSLQVKKVEEEISTIKAEGGSEEKVNELNWQIHDIRMEGASKILRKFPNNHDVRFELAELLVEEEKFDEALPHFQKIQSNPRYRIRACMFVGNCFAGKGVYDLAMDQYKIVIDEVYHMDDNKKEAYYQLGQCYLHLENQEEAIKCFKEIYQVDVGYRDVQELVANR